MGINFRVSQESLDYFEKLAGEYRLDRAAVIRAHLSIAAKHANEVRARLEAIAEGRL